MLRVLIMLVPLLLLALLVLAFMAYAAGDYMRSVRFGAALTAISLLALLRLGIANVGYDTRQ